MHQLILASQSPRRKEILAQAGFQFRVDSVKVSEIIDENLNLDDAIKALAQDKAAAYVSQHKSLKGQKILVLSADTVVVLEGRVLGKPQSFSQAEEFLHSLSSKTHCVKTAICVYDFHSDRYVTELQSSTVEFRPLSAEEIKAYVESGEPMDKAGAYAIQGEGNKFVTRVDGSRDNIVGLPLKKLEWVLEKYGWSISRKQN